ncbi:MAG: hypothetical protein SFV54_04040 [Bryobacteraceae bacterium]|nr:hypothetical protein [Bryobacteraceae bacterium]
MTLRLVAIFAALACVLLAQPASQPLTNRAVEDMLRAGLPQETVELAVHVSAAEGNSNLNAAPDALILLRRAGAGADLLNAIVKAASVERDRAAVAAAVAREAEERKRERPGDLEGLPFERGVYLRQGSSWTAVPPGMAWPRGGEWRWDWLLSIPGNRTRLQTSRQGAAQLSERRPTFYVVGLYPPGGDAYYVARIDEKGRIDAKVRNGVNLKVDEDDQIAAEARTAGRGVVAVRPAEDLEPGRYALMTVAAPGQQWMLQASSFEVR